jgi:hypothetical protein
MKKFEFTATIQPGDGGGAFVFFPFDMEQSFGTTGKVRVHTLIDGIPGTGSLFKYGYPQHILGVLKAVRVQLGKSVGDTVSVVVWSDTAPVGSTVRPAP